MGIRKEIHYQQLDSLSYGRLCKFLEHWTSQVFDLAHLKAITGLSLRCFIELIMQGIARTQSPSPRNYAPESPTFEAIAGVSPPECNGQASPWEYPLVDQGVSCAR